MHVLSVVGSFVDDQGMVDPEVETPGLVVSPLGGSAVVGLAAAVDNAPAPDPPKDGKWVPPEPIRYIVMEMTAVASIDSTALHMLEDMHRDLKTRDIRLAFSTVGNRVEDTLRRSGLTDKMGAHWIFPSVHVAVQHCIRHRERNNVASTDELRKSGRVQVEPAPQEAGEDEEMAATTRPPSSSSHDESEQPGRQVPGARTAAAAVDVQLDKSGGNTLNI